MASRPFGFQSLARYWWRGMSSEDSPGSLARSGQPLRGFVATLRTPIGVCGISQSLPEHLVNHQSGRDLHMPDAVPPAKGLSRHKLRAALPCSLFHGPRVRRPIAGPAWPCATDPTADEKVRQRGMVVTLLKMSRCAARCFGPPVGGRRSLTSGIKESRIRDLLQSLYLPFVQIKQ